MNLTMIPCLGCTIAARRNDGTECAIHGPAARAARSEANSECDGVYFATEAGKAILKTPRDPVGRVQIPLTAMREERDAARAEVERLKQRVSATEAEVKRLNKGLDLYCAKMAADGLNGRDWSARRHYDAWQWVLQWEQSSPRRRVVSALIIEPGPDQQKPLILLAQRKWNQSYPGQWESPGGKVEAGETDEEALMREVREELGCGCKVVHGVASVDLDPPQVLRSLTLTFYRVVLLGKPEPLASDGLRYVSAEEMQQLDLMPANRVLIAHVLAEMGR